MGRNEPNGGAADGSKRRPTTVGILSVSLMRDFNVKQVEMTADKIPDDIKLLVVIHPKGISEATQYALDQFVMRGGNLSPLSIRFVSLDRPPTGDRPNAAG